MDLVNRKKHNESKSSKVEDKHKLYFREFFDECSSLTTDFVNGKKQSKENQAMWNFFPIGCFEERIGKIIIEIFENFRMWFRNPM
jgi:hypothetical protein